ncbi:unnamed protein product, partial [Phaeothamnion confervicola]
MGDKNHSTGLHAAARAGEVAKAEAILSALSFHDAKDLCNNADKHKRSPLHIAAWAGKPEVIALLLRYRADVHAKAGDNFEALHFAAQQGNAEV